MSLPNYPECLEYDTALLLPMLKELVMRALDDMEGACAMDFDWSVKVWTQAEDLIKTLENPPDAERS